MEDVAVYVSLVIDYELDAEVCMARTGTFGDFATPPDKRAVTTKCASTVPSHLLISRRQPHCALSNPRTSPQRFNRQDARLQRCSQALELLLVVRVNHNRATLD